MRATVAIGVTLMLLVPAMARAQGTGPADETAMRRVIQQHDQARSSTDWKGVANLFVEDGTTLTSAGEWRRGRAQIEKGGATLGAGVYKGAKFATAVDNVRLLAPT